MNMQPIINRSEIVIRKASGEEQYFNADKLLRSLINAGAFPDIARKIVQEIAGSIYDGISTKQIYKQAFALLRKNRSRAALRYRLKQAMLELGPTGYPFEQLMGILFQKQGFKVDVGITVKGRHVTHEMDVIATNRKVQNLMECKYHSDQGRQVSVQVPLYVRSRVNDIVSVRNDQPQYEGFEFVGWVVTNTRFSTDAIAYGTGAGLTMLAWDYPSGKGLKEMLERERIFPVTILTQLTIKEKRTLIDQNVVSCSQLHQDLNLLSQFNFSTAKTKSLIREIDSICNGVAK